MINNDINRWQEAISSLPDKQFFNTMRLYLGEIKTPYNKQRLTEQLASFIRREENLQSLPLMLKFLPPYPLFQRPHGKLLFSFSAAPMR